MAFSDPEPRALRMPRSFAKPIALYQGIVDDIRAMIVRGELSPGEKLCTLDELCERYEVSRITAQRALTELRREGVVETYPRRGTFIRGLHEFAPETKAAGRVTKIVAVWGGVTPVHGGFPGPICEGILREAQRRGLGFTLEHVPINVTASPSYPFMPEPDHGIIVVGGLTSSFTYALLMAPDLKSLLIDGSASGVRSVLTDNYEGVRALVEHLAGLGHRRLALGVGFGAPLNTTNENERRESFLHVAELEGLASEVIYGEDVGVLVDRCACPDPPTAFVFTQDRPALDFLARAAQRGFRAPRDFSVTGFDDFPETSEEIGLTTARVDREGLGREAVRSLMEDDAETDPLRRWVRVEPTIVVRRTTGPAPALGGV